jgi:methylated-DNA-[protein]-cysteine S-methyltransferase
MNHLFTDMRSPLGTIRLYAAGGALCAVHLPTFRERPAVAIRRSDDEPVLRAAAQQLEEYFAGARTAFDVPLRLEGSAFQQSAWQALRRIPFGRTCSYGEQARAVGRPTASRAIGGANARNPVAIIVPCHRVIGSDGSLTGYAGGEPTKRWLLAHEAAVARAAATARVSA